MQNMRPVIRQWLAGGQTGHATTARLRSTMAATEEEKTGGQSALRGLPTSRGDAGSRACPPCQTILGAGRSTTAELGEPGEYLPTMPPTFDGTGIAGHNNRELITMQALGKT